MLTAVAVREEQGTALLKSLRWESGADYETVTILAESLLRGQMMPVRVNPYGEVLPGCGAKRCEAALRLGWKRIRVEVVS